MLHPRLLSHVMNQAGRRMQIGFQPVSHTDTQTALLARCKGERKDEILGPRSTVPNMKPQTENKTDISYRTGIALAGKV